MFDQTMYYHQQSPAKDCDWFIYRSEKAVLEALFKAARVRYLLLPRDRAKV